MLFGIASMVGLIFELNLLCFIARYVLVLTDNSMYFLAMQLYSNFFSFCIILLYKQVLQTLSCLDVYKHIYVGMNMYIQYIFIYAIPKIL